MYVGDGARLPYGPRPADEIRRFAREIAGFLEGQGVKLIVAACNSATSAALPELQEQLSVPIIGVLEPEAHAAVQATRNRRIGLLATEATVASGRYEQLVRTLDAGAVVTSVACPALVPLIESDDPFGEETAAAVREYAAPLKERRRGHGHPRLHALPAHPADLPAGLRARRHARLLGGGDGARGGGDAGAEGHRGRRGSRRVVPLPDDRRRRISSARWARGSSSCRSTRSSTSTSPTWSGSPHEERRPQRPTAAAVRDRPRLPRAAARLRARRPGEDEGAVHGVGGGARAPLAHGPGEGLDDGRVLAAARVDRRAHGPRGALGPPAGPHGGDPEAHRTRRTRRRRLRGARRAHALARLRRAPGGRRDALRRDQRRLGGGPSRARPLRAVEGAAGRGGGGLGGHRRRASRCSTSTTPRTRRPTSTSTSS